MSILTDFYVTSSHYRIRLHEVIDEIDKIGEEVPALGGIGLTTPRRSPSPVRPDRHDDLFFFTEEPPDQFGMSPEDYLSPQSKAAAQWEMLQEHSPSPRSRTPTPPRMETPEFLRERRSEGGPARRLFSPMPNIESEPEIESEPSPSKRKKGKKKATLSATSFASTETDDEFEAEEVVVDEQVIVFVCFEELNKQYILQMEYIRSGTRIIQIVRATGRRRPARFTTTGSTIAAS